MGFLLWAFAGSDTGFLSMKGIFKQLLEIFPKRKVLFFYIIISCLMGAGSTLLTIQSIADISMIMNFLSASLTVLLAILAILYFRANFIKKEKIHELVKQCVAITAFGSFMCVFDMFLLTMYSIFPSTGSAILDSLPVFVIYTLFTIVFEVIILSIKRLFKLASQTNDVSI
jgi:hypothetical protein